MGSYLSMPFASRKVVEIEQGKPQTGLSVENGEPKINGEPVDEETIVNLAPNVKKTKEETVEFAPAKLQITIPEEVASEEPAERIPEFRNNANSESVAIKKCNRRHRKHNP